MLGGTDLFHEQVVFRLKQKYPFKHWKTGHGKFLGRILTQHGDGSIVCDQKDYADKVQTIKLSKERRKEKDQPVTEAERRKLRGVVGAANWLMSSTRPDIAVQAGLLQQRVQVATVQDLIEANKLVAKVRDFSHVQVTIRSIPLSESTLFLATDASWSNNEDLKSQAGYFIGLSHRDLCTGSKQQISPLRWKSFKLERHTQSTLGSELMSLARGVAEAEWIRSLFAEAVCCDYMLERDKELRERLPMVVTIDNKPIFDHSMGDGIVVKDKRMAIDMLIVRRDIRQNGICLKWVETGNMLSDCLTKVSAPAGLLYAVLRGDLYGLKLVEPDSKI